MHTSLPLLLTRKIITLNTIKKVLSVTQQQNRTHITLHTIYKETVSDFTYNMILYDCRQKQRDMEGINVYEK